MRILHTSDWHLGRSLHGVDLSRHHEAFLAHLVDVVREERVDAVLVAGDVYDRAIPPLSAVQLLDDALAQLAELTQVVLTPGNHDSAIRLGFGSTLLRRRVAVRADVGDVGTPVIVPSRDGADGLLVYALPYLDPHLARPALASPGPAGARILPAFSHTGLMSAALSRVGADLRDRRRASRRIPAVVTAHAFVTGGQSCASERDIRIGGVDSVPAALFRRGARDLDYVALGHLHAPQRVGAAGADGTLIRYSGSPLAFSFSEKDHRKSCVVVEFDDAGATTARTIPAPAPRRLAEVRGELAQVLSPAFACHQQDWLQVVVTDPVRPPHLYANVKERFPHALVIRHEPPPRDGSVAVAAGSTGADPLEVAAAFVRQVGGLAPTDAERAVLRAAYEAVMAAEVSA